MRYIPTARQLAAVLLVVLAGCGKDSSGDGASGLDGGPRPGWSFAGSSGGAGAGGSPGAGTTGPPAPPGPRPEACSGLALGGTADAGPDMVCTGITQEAERVPLDLYIMMDRSISMEMPLEGGTQSRWQSVSHAIQQFVNRPAAAGIGVGIQFFPQSDGREDAIDCDVSRYAKPDVPIGRLPEVGPAILQSIARHYPGGFTPTLPALRGAVQYARDWARENKGRATAVVLVTDGFPTQCQNPVSVAEIATVAQQAYEGEPRVRTFVIGLAAGYNLDTLARAGGTGRAFLIDRGDATGPFVDALLAISGSRLACEYQLPVSPDPSKAVDPQQVRLVYTAAGGRPEEIPRVEKASDCGRNPNGGWYYDNPRAPAKILVCPCTCERIAAAGRIELTVGCRPSLGIIE